MRSRVVFLLASIVMAHSLGPVLAQPPAPAAAKGGMKPEDERQAFTVPPGFEVQLVASEPDIDKPTQMAFDAMGRLWVATMQSPIVVLPWKASDKVYILSDLDAKGKAGKIEVFADDLNCPMGILPLADCRSCIVSSAGQIRRYTDSWSRGFADKMQVLYRGFGFRDPLGACNSFTLMPDGWVYACQGGLNQSRPNYFMEMNGSLTFRFRPNGSQIEVYTRGLGNSYGLAVDPRFNLYTADSRTGQIAQLMLNAQYEGAVPDGLGYAPLASRKKLGPVFGGLAWYDGELFPKKWQGVLFKGDSAANRIRAERFGWSGSTPAATSAATPEPDFLVSKDPWFRPIDIKLGPDGALYVADFYSPISPDDKSSTRKTRDAKPAGNDTARGRIWRIVWKDNERARVKGPAQNLNSAAGEKLGAAYPAANTTNKLLILNELIDRFSNDRYRFGGSARAKNEWGIYGTVVKNTSDAPGMFPIIAWGFGWLSVANAQEKESIFALMDNLRRQNPMIEPEALIDNQVQLIRAASAFWDEIIPEDHSRVVALLLDPRPRVSRAAVETIIAHPIVEAVKPLAELLRKCPAEDSHLRFAAKIALRNCLWAERAWQPFIRAKEQYRETLPLFAETALGVHSRMAAQFLLSQLMAKQLPPELIPAAVQHIGRFGEAEELTQTTLWLTSLQISQATAQGMIAHLKNLKERKKTLSEIEEKWLLDTMDEELARLPAQESPLPPDDAKRLAAVANVVGELPKLVASWQDKKLKPQTLQSLETLAKQSRYPAELRAAAANALYQAVPKKGSPLVLQLLKDQSIPAYLWENILTDLAASDKREIRLDVRDSLKEAPYRMAVKLGALLTQSPVGGQDLLDAVKFGKVPARLLQEKVILEQLEDAEVPNLNKQLVTLTRGLQPLDWRTADLIEMRSTKFAEAKTDKELGAKVFARHCSACHRIGDKGGKIAPPLDSVGFRGLERLLEDILDPNRNVNQGYRTRVITTKDERTITGLMLRVENQSLIVADSTGKEQSIALKNIDKNQETMLSLMPSNYGELIPEEDFFNLMAFLLDQRSTEPAPKR